MSPIAVSFLISLQTLAVRKKSNRPLGNDGPRGLKFGSKPQGNNSKSSHTDTHDVLLLWHSIFAILYHICGNNNIILEIGLIYHICFRIKQGSIVILSNTFYYP
jgi:hypothetical protein